MRALDILTTPFRIREVRTKILITLGLIGLVRIGSFLPAPGVDYSAIQRCIDITSDNSFYTVINLFSGGALLQLSVFALGIMPYITASIILQLLTVVIPRLEQLKKEGRSGQATITQYTRYLTVGLAVLQATAIVTLARTPGALFSGCPEQLIPNQSVSVAAIMVITMTAGTATVMWIGELITERGIGNGMSLLIFASVIATFPAAYGSVAAASGGFVFAATITVSAVLLVIVVFMEQGQRRIPVHYAKRIVGSRIEGFGSAGSSSYLPLKVNMAGVIPVIFATSMLFLPTLVVQLSGSQADWAVWVSTNLTAGSNWIYLSIFGALVVFFAYFYISITFNPADVARDMKNYGGFVPGIRPGTPTAEYLNYVLHRLTAVGAPYLAAVAIMPILIFGSLGAGDSLAFGGISLLIAVSVGLDTVKQIQSRTEQHTYEGFMSR